MSRETRKDFFLVIITSIASAIGMTSVFMICRPLAWIAILISDSYLSLVLLFAAVLSDDGTFVTRHPFITALFPRRTAPVFVTAVLLVSIVSGLLGPYLRTEVFSL